MPRPTIEQMLLFFEGLYEHLGLETSVQLVAYSAGALSTWLEDPSCPVPGKEGGVLGFMRDTDPKVKEQFLELMKQFIHSENVVDDDTIAIRSRIAGLMDRLSQPRRHREH